MGSTTSCSSPTDTKPKNNTRLYNLLNVQSDYNTEHNTINFSRRDLVNTLSDRSILDVMHGGGDVKLNNRPSRDRYSQYESQKIKNHNQNLIGGHLDQFSSVSEAELNGLKKLVMNGAGHLSGKCNCGENSVLNLNGGGHGLSSSYNPLNSMTMSDSIHQGQFGGDCGSANYSATSSYMPSQIGSALMSATSVSDAALNVNSANNSANYSATSSYMPSQIGSALMSATSVSNAALNENYVNNSATSSYMPSQNGSALMSATSVSSASSSNTLVAPADSANSNIARLQRLSSVLNGGNLDALSASSVSSMSTVSHTMENQMNGGAFNTSSSSSSSSMSTVSCTMENQMNGGALNTSSSSMSTVSRTSENAINYNDLIGGAGDETVTDGKSSSSTTSTESTTTKTGTETGTETESTVKHTESRLNRLSNASKSDSRSSRASSTSSSDTSGGSSSSSTPGSGSSSSTSYRSSDSSSTSSRSTTENATVTQQKYVLSSMSEGNVIDAKQFYSSDYGELYGSENNYLRNNLTKRRFR